MTFTRTFKRKNKDGTIKTYYAEVESVRVEGKVVQRLIRSLGTDPKNPTKIPIDSSVVTGPSKRIKPPGKLSSNLPPSMRF